jgi:Domain of unknown function (DUF4402)
MRLSRLLILIASYIGPALVPAALSAEECRLCTSQPSGGEAGKPERQEPLHVDIISGLSFNRTAHTGNGGGQISVDTNGTSNIRGGLINLGGYAVAGNALVRGAPGRIIRIDLPSNVQMTSSTGSKIEIVDLRTDLPASPRLDSSGQLSFSFGGELNVAGDLSGSFRGRIPITAQYE